MIVDMSTELRDYIYITNVYKCISAYNLKGHQIGRKIGDMLEILTMGGVYQDCALVDHLDTEGKLEGYTTAGHKVEFGFYENLKDKKNLFGAIECKCVGVEETTAGKGKKNLRILHINESFDITFSARWLPSPVTFTLTLKEINTDCVNVILDLNNGKSNQELCISITDNIKVVLDEAGQILFTTPTGNMVDEIPGIIRKCKTIRISNLSATTCTFSLSDCLPGPQTIEKAKQASLVAMDLRKKIDNHWGIEDIDSTTKKMTFIHVICEFSHWESKSRNVIKTCIDHNLIVPDAILIKSFDTFEEKFGTDKMLDYISKNLFISNLQVQNTVNEILKYFDYHIFYDISLNSYVKFKYDNNKLTIVKI